jgi:hypothetical protein
MALLHEGFCAGKSGLCCDPLVQRLWAACVCTNQSHVFFVGCLSLGPRENDLTNYWALGPFVRPFTSLVDPGDIYPPQVRATLAISPCPVRDCLFMNGIAGFKLTLSHSQGMWLDKIVLDQQAYIRIQSLIDPGGASPVPSPSLDLSISILRIVSVP